MTTLDIGNQTAFIPVNHQNITLGGKKKSPSKPTVTKPTVHKPSKAQPVNNTQYYHSSSNN